MLAVGLVGLSATPSTAEAGTNSCMNSRRLRETSTLKLDTPVRFPLGRDKLFTTPSATGSPPISKTMGIVAVADFAASAGGAPPTAAITATFRFANSAASAGKRSY